MKYNFKPRAIEAFTFDDIVQHGIKSGAHIVNGMPWSFSFHGLPVTHETDQLYIVAGWKITPQFILVKDGEDWYREHIASFEKVYEPAASPNNTQLSPSIEVLNTEIEDKIELEVQRLLESMKIYLFCVKLLRQNPENPAQFERSEEFYVAQDIKDVWAGLKRELNDESVEVESITRDVPILAFIA